MEHLYKILRLPHGADKKQIRKAYKRLARQYHPDVNPSADAHQRFLEIQAAYEQLLQQQENPFPELEAFFNQTSQAVQQEELRRQQAEQRARERAQRYAHVQGQRAKANAEWDKSLRRNFTIFLSIGLVLSVLFIADRFLPVVQKNAVVTHISRNNIVKVQTTDTDQKEYKFNEGRWFRVVMPHETLSLQLSPILGIVREVHHIEGSFNGRILRPVNLHSLSFFYWMMFVASAWFAIGRKKISDLTFILLGMANLLGMFASVLFLMVY